MDTLMRMPWLLFLPALICFLLPLLNAIAKDRAETRRQREAAEARKAKSDAIAKAKAQREAEKAAERERKAAEEAAKPKRKPGRPRKTQTALEAPKQVPAAPEQSAQKAEERQAERSETISVSVPNVKGNNAFAGQVVAFTGTLPGMTRKQAIQAVRDNGGQAYETMPASTTLLVVGDNPGMGKMDKADAWIAHVRKITANQFFSMLHQPLTMNPDEFAAFVATMQ